LKFFAETSCIGITVTKSRGGGVSGFFGRGDVCRNKVYVLFSRLHVETATDQKYSGK